MRGQPRADGAQHGGELRQVVESAQIARGEDLAALVAHVVARLAYAAEGRMPSCVKHSRITRPS